jgi:hypothetical protein
MLQEMHGGQSGAADFMDLGSNEGGSARQFGADGFFGRVESALERRSAGRSHGTAIPPIEGSREPGDVVPPDNSSPTFNAVETARHSPRAERATTRPVPPPRTGTNGRVIGSLPVDGNAPVDQRSRSMGSEERPAALSRPPSSSGRARELFKLIANEASIHVSGPFHDLSDEERTELIEEIADILHEHGYSLQDLWFNGQRAPLPRKQS